MANGDRDYVRKGMGKGASKQTLKNMQGRGIATQQMRMRDVADTESAKVAKPVAKKKGK
jgi:hypothetical protein